jgi:excisionase family DNA binding protein
MQAEVVREWMTYRQAEEVYALSRTTLRTLVADGTIKARKVGRAVRLNRISLDAFMDGEEPTDTNE